VDSDALTEFGTSRAQSLLLELLPEMRPKILVVEDDAVTRQLLKGILEGEGCEVEIAVDGERAIGALAQRRVDAIILDLALPKMSGTDVMDWIASTTPQVLNTIVVVTGLEQHEIRNLFPDICETLSKPVLPGRLLASVRRCLPRTLPTDVSGVSVA
jgi:CheY-like chemotaxis protein